MHLKPSPQSTWVERAQMEHSWPIVIEKSIMLSGRSSLMMNSWNLMSMESWLYAVMAFGVTFTLVYLHILQTTRRSKPRLFWMLVSLAQSFERILIASICNLGQCPCPCCLIPLDHVANMGMHQDMAQCRTLARVDNVKQHARRYMRRAMWLIVQQWKIFYKKILLFRQQYVPSLLYNDWFHSCFVRMHFQAS